MNETFGWECMSGGISKSVSLARPDGFNTNQSLDPSPIKSRASFFLPVRLYLFFSFTHANKVVRSLLVRSFFFFPVSHRPGDRQIIWDKSNEVHRVRKLHETVINRCKQREDESGKLVEAIRILAWEFYTESCGCRSVCQFSRDYCRTVINLQRPDKVW